MNFEYVFKALYIIKIVTMGVDIGDLFRWEKISLKDLHDRIIVIDAHNVLHQFLASIRQRDGRKLLKKGILRKLEQKHSKHQE